MYAALTIAGNYSGGGAGIRAGVKTVSTHHVCGMSAVTKLTAPGTAGVEDITEKTPEFLKEQPDPFFQGTC